MEGPDRTLREVSTWTVTQFVRDADEVEGTDPVIVSSTGAENDVVYNISRLTLNPNA